MVTYWSGAFDTRARVRRALELSEKPIRYFGPVYLDEEGPGYHDLVYEIQSTLDSADDLCSGCWVNLYVEELHLAQEP